MRVLVVSAPGVGHVFPMVPLTWALRAAGHDVLVATSSDGLAVAEAGLPVVDALPGVNIREQFTKLREENPEQFAEFANRRITDVRDMGEFLPFMRSRLDSRYRIHEPENPLERTPSGYIGTNVLATTSGVFSPAALTGAVLEIGADSIMFAIDYPYETTRDAVDGFEHTTLSATDRAKIAHLNAERLLRM